MLHGKKKYRKKAVRLLAVVGLLSVFFMSFQVYAEDVVGESRSAIVAGSNLVNVRSDAGTGYDKVAQLVRYQPVTILSEKSAANGVVWYKIRFSLDGVEQEGYIHSTYIMETRELEEGDQEDLAFEEEIALFPESYKPVLRSLHKIFPNWTFEPVLTGISWSQLVEAESVLTRNLVPDSSAFSWKSVRDGDYDWESDTWIAHDTGWVGASKEAIAYYLDPRNFLAADSRITQFETLAYAEGLQNETGLAAILNGSFMGNSTYYAYFLEAAKQAGVSPYLLASRCLQEVGKEGSSTTTGTYFGYEGYYNFFNIGASPNADGTGAVENAMKYAVQMGWDSPEKSIIGGACILGADYIAKGQNTFYFQKFNVVNPDGGLFSHQYMQNLSAASTEGASLQKTYTDWENASILYRIPVYEDMPEEAAPLPVGLTNNYRKLSSLTVNGEEPEGFQPEKAYYEVTVPAGILEISGSCSMKSASVALPKTVCLTTGTYEKQVVVTAQDGTQQSYLLHITAEEGLTGDVDGNGCITAEDALGVLKNVVGSLPQEGEGISCLDVDKSASVTAEDALLILKYVVGTIDNFS
jgi:beta-N-acetylglucosaminidase